MPDMNSSRPNVVLILTDDQGWGDLSLHGNTNLETPHIDGLARDGAMFDRFYVCPVCAPTRAELLTGRYHLRGGVHGVTVGEERLNTDENTIGDTFQHAGYATGAFGKWHNGTQYPYHPNARGFEEFYGFCSGHWGHYFHPVLEHNGQFVRGTGFIADDLTDHALDFIEEHRDGPFLCYLPYNIPHSPFQVPDRFYDRFRNHPLPMRHRDSDREDPESTRAALALCENVDWNVGRILARLDELSLAQNTVVVYLSDNGPNGRRWNGGMKGQKGSTDEGGVRVPCVMRWPGHIRAGAQIEGIAGAIDLLPTLADLSGIPVVGDKPLDGRSIVPALLGNSTLPERMIFSHHRGRVSVRTQQHRLDHGGALFDLVSDPGQYNDVSDAQPKVTSRLREAVQRWREDVFPASMEETRPFPVGYREFPSTYLPARDGVPSGGIERSSRHPNCSFFTNWSDSDGAITWNVEVATSGDYEAIVHYTCGQDDVGSTVELGLGTSRTRSVVAEAHDPPLVGAEHDRVLRGESYVKDFRPFPLGTLHLQQGEGTLALRALQVPGDAVMEVGGITLRLLGEE